MGNCIVKESSTQWGGDDWGSPSPVPSEAQKPVFSGGVGHGSKLKYMKPIKMEEQKSFLGGKKGADSLPPPTKAGSEVKIKITKKQLEELLSKVDVQGKPVKEVLTQLLSLGDHGSETQPRSWRPALQSIPEAEVY